MNFVVETFRQSSEIHSRAKYLLQRISYLRIHWCEGAKPMTAATATVPGITTWNIDPAHSHAEFKVKHMMISNVK